MVDDRRERILEGVRRARRGDGDSVDQTMELVYDELRALAAAYLARERPEHTLRPTALVHEAYLRLAGGDISGNERSHFFRIAARQMRRVLVDHARARGRQKREGGAVRVTLTDAVAVALPDVDVLALNEALDKLDASSPEDRTIVELKFFGGLSEPEIADATGMSERTIRRRWSFARAWLLRELS